MMMASAIFVLEIMSTAAMAKKLVDDICEAEVDEIITDFMVLAVLIGAAVTIGVKVMWA